MKRIIWKNFISMEKETIDLSEDFESLLSLLYGKQKYHQFAGSKTKNEWEKIILKVISSIELSIANTIENCDTGHKNYLLQLCQETKERISKSLTINELNEEIILELFKIIFNLIGDQPNHWDHNKINKTDDWKLSEHRQLMYYQSNQHKTNLIIDEAPEDYNGKYTRRLLIEKLNRDFKRNYSEFIDWHKENFRVMHDKLF